jgi:hypothetical protein
MFFNRVAAWPFGPPKGMKNRPVAKMRRTKWSVEAGFSTERRLSPDSAEFCKYL